MEINKAIKNRWSPKMFSDKAVSDEMLESLFEAARWAPSARNEQPWQYYYAKNSDENFNSLVKLLTGNNPDWAKNAQVLMVSVLKKNYDHKNRPNKNALHDVGAANVSLAIQAAEIGLQVHQMAGFDKEKTIEFLALNDEEFTPVTFIAVGFPAEKESLTDEEKMLEYKLRKRKSNNSFVHKL